MFCRAHTVAQFSVTSQADACFLVVNKSGLRKRLSSRRRLDGQQHYTKEEGFFPFKGFSDLLGKPDAKVRRQQENQITAVICPPALPIARAEPAGGH